MLPLSFVSFFPPGEPISQSLGCLGKLVKHVFFFQFEEASESKEALYSRRGGRAVSPSTYQPLFDTFSLRLLKYLDVIELASPVCP